MSEYETRTNVSPQGDLMNFFRDLQADFLPGGTGEILLSGRDACYCSATVEYVDGQLKSARYLLPQLDNGVTNTYEITVEGDAPVSVANVSYFSSTNSVRRGFMRREIPFDDNLAKIIKNFLESCLDDGSCYVFDEADCQISEEIFEPEQNARERARIFILNQAVKYSTWMPRALSRHISDTI